MLEDGIQSKVRPLRLASTSGPHVAPCPVHGLLRRSIYGYIPFLIQRTPEGIGHECEHDKLVSPRDF